jgi:hypothetical protein
VGEQRGCGRALLDLKRSWESATGFGEIVGEHYWIWRGRGRVLLDSEGLWESVAGFGRVVGERGRGRPLLDLDGSCVGPCHMIFE